MFVEMSVYLVDLHAYRPPEELRVCSKPIWEACQEAAKSNEVRVYRVKGVNQCLQ